MGIGFVLLIWAIVGVTVASVGTLVLGGATAYFTRGIQQGRQKAILAGRLFPFYCLAWGGAVFVFQAVINEGVLHRDLGLGDTWHCPLSNGYALMMIDVTDQGWIYNPKTQVGSSVVEKGDTVAGVRTIQLAGPYILGGRDSQWFEHSGQENEQVDSYFLLDTRTGKRSDFSSYDALRGGGLQLGIQLNLKSIYSVYSQYRFTWFDVFAGLLACGPPLAGAWLLVRRILSMRRTRGIVPQIA
jgi:hypothetical protein